MTARCPTCSRPLYPTNRGGLICIRCRKEPTAAEKKRNYNREYHKDYRKRLREGKVARRAAKGRQR